MTDDEILRLIWDKAKNIGITQAEIETALKILASGTHNLSLIERRLIEGDLQSGLRH